MIKELLELWDEYVGYMINAEKLGKVRYSDDDFTFQGFIYWLKRTKNHQ